MKTVEKNPTYDRLVQIIVEDTNDLVVLCLQLGNTTSPHGKERVLGEAVLGWMNMWRDLNVFNEVGIPSICYGPLGYCKGG